MRRDDPYDFFLSPIGARHISCAVNFKRVSHNFRHVFKIYTYMYVSRVKGVHAVHLHAQHYISYVYLFTTPGRSEAFIFVTPENPYTYIFFVPCRPFPHHVNRRGSHNVINYRGRLIYRSSLIGF